MNLFRQRHWSRISKQYPRWKVRLRHSVQPHVTSCYSSAPIGRIRDLLLEHLTRYFPSANNQVTIMSSFILSRHHNENRYGTVEVRVQFHVSYCTGQCIEALHFCRKYSARLLLEILTAEVICGFLQPTQILLGLYLYYARSSAFSSLFISSFTISYFIFQCFAFF